MLSKIDMAFLEEFASRKSPDELANTEVGKLVSEAKLSKLNGKRLSNAELDELPEYYILYFSASW